MFAKVLALIVGLAAIAAVMLALRQERFGAMNEMARLHAQMNRHRQEMWQLQVQIAQDMQPQKLRQAIERAKLELVPVTPVPAPPPRMTAATRRPR